MELSAQLEADYLQAFRRHDQAAVGALRQLRASLHNAEIAARGPLAEAAGVAWLRRELKQREEAAAAFEAGGRPEQAAAERAEAQIVASYLPPAMGEEELGQIVRQTVAELGSPAFGQAMKAVLAKVGGRASGEQVSAAVKSALESAEAEG